MVLVSILHQMAILINIEILNFFYKEYVREEILSEDKYPIQDTDLGFQVDQKTSEEISTFGRI